MNPFQEEIDHFKKYEDDVPYFYLDDKGLVTIGIGCRVWTKDYAITLPMVTKDKGQVALTNEIIKEYEIVSNLQPNRTKEYYSVHTDLYLPKEQRVKLFIRRSEQFNEAIKSKFLDLSDYPIPAKLVFKDMVFTMGEGKLERDFPNFLRYFLAKDFKSASKECHRLDISVARNDWAKNVLEIL